MNKAQQLLKVISESKEELDYKYAKLIGSKYIPRGTNTDDLWHVVNNVLDLKVDEDFVYYYHQSNKDTWLAGFTYEAYDEIRDYLKSVKYTGVFNQNKYINWAQGKEDIASEGLKYMSKEAKLFADGKNYDNNSTLNDM